MSSAHNLDNRPSLMETQFATKRSPLPYAIVSQAPRPATSRPHPAAPAQQTVTLARRRRPSGHPQVRGSRVGKRLKIADEEPSFDVEHLFQLSEAILTFAPFDTTGNERNDPFSNETSAPTSYNRRLFSCKFLRESQEAFWNVREKEAALCLHHKLRERAKFLRKIDKAKERHTTQQNVERSQEKILRCVNKIVNGHTNLERWRLRVKYYAQRGEDPTRRKCSDCKKLRQCRPGYEYGDWNFGLLEEDGTVLANPLDELD